MRIVMLLMRLKQFWCGLRGHEDIFKVDGKLLKLQCLNCLRLTTGFTHQPPTE